MLIALLADVHANEPALLAVLEEARRLGACRHVCLGDLVGYNASPNECIEALELHDVACLMGNHDMLALGDDDPLATKPALDVARWTRSTLSSSARSFLASLPRELDYEWGSLVHGCWLNPRRISGYVTATMAPYNLASLAKRAPRGRYLGAFGHTHHAVIHDHHGRDLIPKAGATIQLPEGEVVLVNPGSVGQPRDGDPRASFAILDLESWSLTFRRVAYDVARAADAIMRAGLDASLASRLFEAR